MNNHILLFLCQLCKCKNFSLCHFFFLLLFLSPLGVGVLSFDATTPVPAAALPLELPSSADLDSERAGNNSNNSRSLQYLIATNAALWLLSYRHAHFNYLHILAKLYLVIAGVENTLKIRLKFD